jgi:hypothetical protein
MGSDFTVSVIAIKNGDELAYKDRVINGINELTDSWLTDNFDELYPITLNESKSLKPQLIELVNRVWEAFNSRNVAWYELNGSTLYIAGGLTWGDDPTDEYSLFDQFNRLNDILDDDARALIESEDAKEVKG